MKKWNDLRNMLIEGLNQAEAGDLHEQEKFCRTTLEMMDKLDTVHKIM